MTDLLAVERELDGAAFDSPAASPLKLPSGIVNDLPEVQEGEDRQSTGQEAPFHASKKSNTLKKYYKKLFKKKKETDKIGVDGEQREVGASSAAAAAAATPSQVSTGPASPHHQEPWRPPPLQQPPEPQPYTATGASGSSRTALEDGDEATSGAAAAASSAAVAIASPSSRYTSGRFDTGLGSQYERAAVADEGGGSSVAGSGADSRMGTFNSSTAGSMGGTIKGFLGPRKKKNKQYELDALRMEMGMLQERVSVAENGLNSASHDVNALRIDRDMLQQQLHERTLELTSTRAAASKAEEEVARLKALHAQVKGALQGAYSQNQDLSKQIQELEGLCTAQQNSLEEAEERYRALSDSHDALRHAGLQAKAQLVTAQAQVGELRAVRDELTAEVSCLEQQLAALKAQLDEKEQRVLELETSKSSLESQMEGMLGRLRELEGEKQQLEARQILLQEENLDLGRRVEELRDEGRGLEARMAQLQGQNAELASQLDRTLEALAAEKQRYAAERHGLAAELRSSADLREVLQARNDELATEVGALREAAASKKGSPLRWRKAKQTSAAASPAAAPRPGSAEPEFGPMTKQRALFTKGGALVPPAAQQQAAVRGQQQQVVGAGMAPVQVARGLSSLDDSDVTAHVTTMAAAPYPQDPDNAAALAASLEGCGTAAGSTVGLSLPAPLCSDSPDLTGHKAQQQQLGAGPLAAGRTGGGGAAAGGEGAARGRADRDGGTGGFLGGLFSCFNTPAVRLPVAAA